jgi:L-seryl-tRNA(Ser) seleniumtransferase
LVTEEKGYREMAAEFGDGAAKLELRALLRQTRESIRRGKAESAPAMEDLLGQLRVRLLRLRSPLGRRAINATGILLHTGLGRAPLSSSALEALAHFDRYSVLQADIEENRRSQRDEKVARLLCELTGAEAATVVNNNAAATMLILNTFALGQEVIISRGQLVEIGGAFRIPDVLVRSGAILREVGTTNRTHLRDYEEAINDRTAALMHVHTSNYRVRGFAGTPSVAQLVELGRRRGLKVIDDLGSGALVPLNPYGLPNEPLVADSLAAGADVVCFSGDKLICGPQSGLILGRQALMGQIRKNPFARMFRVCKMTLAVLEATLLHFINAASELKALPFYQMLSKTMDELEAQAAALRLLLAHEERLEITVSDDIAYVGSGSIPDEGLPTKIVQLLYPKLRAEVFAKRLRVGLPSVFSRLKEGKVALDMRTVAAEELELLASCITAALANLPTPIKMTDDLPEEDA